MVYDTQQFKSLTALMGLKRGWFSFLVCHVVFMFCGHLLAIAQYFNFYLNTVLVVFYVSSIIINGAQFNREINSKIYLRQIEELI
jgi:hypothetical protein